ncbi:MAG: glycosyltransferase [Vicingaceae bacterium]
MIYFISILTFITTIYVCSIVWVIIGFFKIREKEKTTANQEIKISIIIAARNEEENILHCLNTLAEQNYNKDFFEVIVVNDHSTDKTEKLVNSFIKENDLNVQFTSLTDKTSKKEALKHGLELARHEVIATTDADCVLPQNWLLNISNHFISETDMLLGPVMFNKAKGFLSAFQTLDLLAIQGVEFGALGFNQPILNNAANLSYISKTYKNVNGFDSFNTPSGDDIFLLEKFKKKIFKIKGILAQDFIVETKSESSLSGFFNQRVRWSSKAKHYSDKLLLFFSGLILLQNISLLLIYTGLLFVENHQFTLLILLLTKWLIDFILLFLVASFFRRKSVMFYFIPVQLLYPFYVIIIWIASVFMKFEWKGRKY